MARTKHFQQLQISSKNIQNKEFTAESWGRLVTLTVSVRGDDWWTHFVLKNQYHGKNFKFCTTFFASKQDLKKKLAQLYYKYGKKIFVLAVWQYLIGRASFLKRDLRARLTYISCFCFVYLKSIDSLQNSVECFFNNADFQDSINSISTQKYRTGGTIQDLWRK